MSYLDDYDYDEDLIGEAPCEFCGDLYPLILLTEHQTTHLNETYVGFHEDIPIEFLEEINPLVETVTVQPEIEVEQKPIQSDIPKVKEEIPAEVVTGSSFIEATETKPKAKEILVVPLKTSARPTETKEREFMKYQKQTIEEFTTESGEKLLVYGAGIDPDKDLESEKQTYKMPNNPLLSSVNKEDDIEDINNLSDDDCDECLEEFWKKARDYVKRNRGKIERH